MSPVVQALALLCFCIPAEVVRELCFKMAADRAEARGGLFPAMLGEATLWIGLLFWASELVAWIMVLQRLPLGVAFPLMTLSYAAIPAAAHFWLKDRLNRRQWLGVLFVTGGVALVGLGGL